MAGDVNPLLATLQSSPEDPEVLRSIQARLIGEGRIQELSRVMEWWADMAPDDQSACEALLDAARLIEGDRKQLPRVIHLLEQALRRNPAADHVASRLESLLREVRDHRALERVLQWQADELRMEGHDPALCAEASYRLGHLRLHQLRDADGAVAAFEDALRTWPKHREARRALAVLYANRAQRRRDAPGDGPASDKRRAAELWYALSESAEDSHSALHDLRQALRLAPGYRAALDALEQRCGDDQDESVIEGWRGYVQEAPASVRADERRLRLARRLLSERRPREAAEHLQALATRGNDEARRLLERIEPGLVSAPLPPDPAPTRPDNDARRTPAPAAPEGQAPVAPEAPTQPRSERSVPTVRLSLAELPGLRTVRRMSEGALWLLLLGALACGVLTYQAVQLYGDDGDVAAERAPRR